MFLRFVHSRTRILTKNATLWSTHQVFVCFDKVFPRKMLRTLILDTSTCENIIKHLFFHSLVLHTNVTCADRYECLMGMTNSIINIINIIIRIINIKSSSASSSTSSLWALSSSWLASVALFNVWTHFKTFEFGLPAYLFYLTIERPRERERERKRERESERESYMERCSIL